MEQYIVFYSHQQRFALPITEIEKIIQSEPAVPVPEIATYITGVITYNQLVVPIVDLSQRLYQVMTTVTAETKIMMVSWQGKIIGLIIDKVEGIFTFEDIQYEEQATELETSKAYIAGFIKTAGEIILLIEIKSIFDQQLTESVLNFVENAAEEG